MGVCDWVCLGTTVNMRTLQVHSHWHPQKSLSVLVSTGVA